MAVLRLGEKISENGKREHAKTVEGRIFISRYDPVMALIGNNSMISTVAEMHCDSTRWPKGDPFISLCSGDVTLPPGAECPVGCLR